ncbi:MAG: hypothetical protein ABI947_26175 [Chloroflexota bacterium]
MVIFSFFSVYKTLWSSEFTYSRQSIATFQTATEPLLIYDPHATNAWCNTVLTRIGKHDGFRFPPELFLSAPSGIGISYYMDTVPEGLVLPPRSKYLLLTDEAYQLIADKLHVQPLLSTNVGTLYYNLDSGCTLSTPAS